MVDAGRLLEIADSVEVCSVDDGAVANRAARLLQIVDDVPPLQERRGSFRWARQHMQAASAKARATRQAPVKKLVMQAVQTQRAVHNKEVASKDDYTMSLDGSTARSSKGTKSGRWKQRTGEEACRIIFHKPATTMVEVARSLKPCASSRHCTDLVFAGYRHGPTSMNRHMINII